MSGTIYIAENVEWSTNSLVFFWLMELISETVRDEEVATVLREISEANLKWLYFDDLDDRAQQVIRRYIRDDLMPNAESRLLPRTKERQIVIDSLKELVRLVT